MVIKKKTSFSLCWKHAVMMLSRCQPAVPLFFFFLFVFFYKEDNNADSVLPAGERKEGPGQRRTERTRVEKKRVGGGIMGQRGTSMGEAGRGIIVETHRRLLTKPQVP